MEYTKGPWTWNEDEAAVVAGTPEKGKIICYPEKYSKKEFYGNKNLIAAAPDMYEALKEFENQLPELWGDGIRNGKVTLTLDADVIDGIMDAIRKAEGRTD